ncbi:MAG: hypothetical protein Q9P01_10175 [Anaerolineae bacterium]|nr:hypothetical protein [Anaerolineae bacterium]
MMAVANDYMSQAQVLVAPEQTSYFQSLETHLARRATITQLHKHKAMHSKLLKVIALARLLQCIVMKRWR